MRKLFYYHFCVVVVNCHWFYNKRILLFHLKKKYIKSHSVKYWEPDWLFRFTIVFQLNNGKNIWSSLKMQWQLSHLTNDCVVWPWSAKQLMLFLNAKFINISVWTYYFVGSCWKTSMLSIIAVFQMLTWGLDNDILFWRQKGLAIYHKLMTFILHHRRYASHTFYECVWNQTFSKLYLCM